MAGAAVSASTAAALSVAMVRILRRAGLDAFARLERVEIVRQQVEVGLADALGEHDAVGLALHDDGEIAQRQAGVERVDADIELGAGAVGALEIGERHVARDLLAVGGDESSRSRIRPSGRDGPLASLRSESAGTNRKERICLSASGRLAHQRLARALGDDLAALVDGGVVELDDAGIGPRLALAHAKHLGRTCSVSPWNTGLGKRTSVMPRLAIVVPSVVSFTVMPIIRPSVNRLLTMRWPNSVFERTPRRDAAAARSW